jgi:hypothetical protein
MKGLSKDSLESLLAYKETKNKYKNLIQKLKRNSWKEFTSCVEKYTESCRMFRILNNSKQHLLGRLQKSDGTYTNSTDGSHELLLQTHFPCDQNKINLPLNHHPMYHDVANKIVTEKSIQRPIKSFGGYKAAGPDEIFPAMLQSQLSLLNNHLARIFKACLIFGYAPKAWRQAKVLFIRKPGKDSYENLSSWRPIISFQSFLLKALEHLVDWHIRTPALLAKLKESNQFAYMTGVSTDTALHQMVARIERTLKSGTFGICLVLDVEGAFNSTTVKSMIDGLERNRIDPMSIRWISSMMYNREVGTFTHETPSLRVAETGCP